MWFDEIWNEWKISFVSKLQNGFLQINSRLPVASWFKNLFSPVGAYRFLIVLKTEKHIWTFR